MKKITHHCLLIVYITTYHNENFAETTLYVTSINTITP